MHCGFHKSHYVLNMLQRLPQNTQSVSGGNSSEEHYIDYQSQIFFQSLYLCQQQRHEIKSKDADRVNTVG